MFLKVGCGNTSYSPFKKQFFNFICENSISQVIENSISQVIKNRQLSKQLGFNAGERTLLTQKQNNRIQYYKKSSVDITGNR